MEVLLSFIISFINMIYAYHSSLIIFKQKKRNIKEIFLPFLLYCLFYFFIIFFMDSTYSMFFISIMYIPLIKILLKRNLVETITLSLILYFTVLIFEFLITSIISNSMIDAYLKVYDYNMVKLIIDFLAVIFSKFTIFIFSKYYRKTVTRICNYKYVNIVLVILFYINIIISIVTRYRYIELNNSTIADCIVIITLVFVFVYSMDKNDKLQSLSNCYNEICDYSKSSEELNYDYRMKIHENKNQLLLIRGMVKKNNNILLKYIDNLLDLSDSDVDNNYLSLLDRINIPGLKNFINYKLMILRKMNSQIELFVSEDISLINVNAISDTDYYNMTTIIGVLLDNIIDCLRNQKNKLVSIIIYVNNDNLCFKFANNIEKQVDLDCIYNKGFSTKGSKRGVGLNLIKDIVDNSKRFECNTSIVDDFFVQDVIIKIPKIIF